MRECSSLRSNASVLQFIYSEKATKFCEIFNLLLSYEVPVKSKVKISQNYVAFSEYMNFNRNGSPSDLCIMTLFKRDCGMVRGGFQEKTVFSLNFSFGGNNKKWSGPLLTLCPDIKN